jgi:sterol desaturase/sphingolipid hydroxylase (fatty acid hydroxylase superfamily)
MPTPLEILLDPISLVILAMYAGLMLWEAVTPGRDLPKIPYWKIRGLSVFAFYFYLSSYLPIYLDQFLAPYQLLNLTGLGVVGGGLFGVLLYEFGVYIWHRAMHKSDWLWRIFHQMHHSVERIDTYGAFYFSPMDMIGWTVLGSLCFTLFTGLAPQAITIMLLTTTFLGIFQHANIKTPRWLGYIIQRPESHTIHHAKNIHAYNYSDLPLFDILFGTFKNPKSFDKETGFYNGASKRILDMLLFRDIANPAVENPKQSGDSREVKIKKDALPA